MKLVNEKKFNDNLPNGNNTLDPILQALVHQLQIFPPHIDELTKECENFKKYLINSSYRIDPQRIKPLIPFFEKSKDDIAEQLFSIAEVLVPKLTDPWTFMERILSSRNEKLVLKSLDLLKNLANKHLIDIDEEIIIFFAERQVIENNTLSNQQALKKIAEIFSLMPGKSQVSIEEQMLVMFLGHGARNLRILSAKLLDANDSPASEETIIKLFGAEAAEKLLPYLRYTCATYLDLFYLIPKPGKSPPIIESLERCQQTCGENIIKEVIAKLGWKFVNYGLSVKHYVGISFNESLPLFVSENEARLFEKNVRTQRISEMYLFTAHGGLPLESGESENENKPVSLFRSYNLAHAKLLQEILDIAPLTYEKVMGILRQMDRIVHDFVALFKSYSEECSILPEVYANIKNKIMKDLEEDSEHPHLSADISRLVQMFEDPRTLGGVHTLHGLKRYLHQKGLQLGFKLVDQTKSPNQSVNLVLASETKVLSVIKKINFADFESESEVKISTYDLPYTIRVVIDAFGRQLLHGQDKFPSVNIFCYGNEIHYFVWFRNHPIFIRIDYSTPLQGGMIDLQYFGVSNYEIADHPNIYLDAIRTFFQFLEFDVKMEGTHIQARYDKERALDLNQLCERVEYLFCLVPYMMDLDWIIGSLNLSSYAKDKVARAWSELFTRWGVLPINKILTKDSLGILQDVLISPEGEHELVWSGEDDYRDKYTIKIQRDFFERIYDAFKKLEIKIPKFSEENFNQIGQIYLEKRLLNPLRESLSKGEIIKTPEGFKKVSSDLFQRIHEADCFAEIIIRGGKDMEFSISLAKVIIPLEQTLKFQTTGTLESFKVQSASLPLKGDNLNIYVLRDYKGIIRMAFFIHGNLLFQKRKNAKDSWTKNTNLSSFELMSLLRYNNYNVPGSEPSLELIKDEIQTFKDELTLSSRQAVQNRIPGEKIIMGLSASPGRVTGRVLLGIARRVPEDFVDHILVASSISPNENTFIFHSSGIVATGGGILSHAGLIANQFDKPALIISGKWKQESEGLQILNYNTLEFKIELKTVNNFNITLYYDFQEIEYQMRDGDLVSLDTDEGNLQVLGQERDTIALYEGLKSLGRTNEDISKVNDVQQLLVLRGKKLHIRHKIEKILQRLSEPVLAKYAVQEILIGNFLAGIKSTPEEKIYLLTLILENNKIGDFAEDCISQTAREIEISYIRAYSKAEKNIPIAQYPFEVIMPRLEVFKLLVLLKNVITSLSPKLSQKINVNIRDVNDLNNISIRRLEQLHINLIDKTQYLTGNIEQKEILRHLFRQLNRVNLLINKSFTEQSDIKKLQDDLEINDTSVCQKYGDRFILRPGDGTIELAPMIGWKAANLAELEQLGGNGLVPLWFVITDKAFQHVLDTPVKEIISHQVENISVSASLRDVIDDIVSRNDINNNDKSTLIRNLWNLLSLPADVKKEVIQSYQELEKNFSEGSSNTVSELKPFIAIRSSSCEEDAEIAARAGEFETYLFIQGEDLLIDYLKRTWSGLWTERAIHNRSVMGSQKIQTRGGVIVQRIVWSRVSGVLQTINVAKNNLNEIVINAGLGLGEGVVSGIAAADQIIVSKEGDLQKGPLHFNYITSDKKEQVLFNKKAGFSTVLTSTLYHQRFRPALEYVELCELVAVASRLETAYGYPLDIEFGIEGTKLWILQVRPVATYLPALNETIKNYPILDSYNRYSQEKLK